MGNKKTLLLGLGAMIFGGCYSGVDDAGGGASVDRFGKYCYTSTDSSSSAGFTTDAKPSGGGATARGTDDGFTLTMKAEPSSSSAEEMSEVLDQLRFQAASTAQYFIQTSCGAEDGFGQVIDACKDTCAQQGLAIDDVVLCDLECELVDGSIECNGPLPKNAEEALSQPWYGENSWVYQTGEGLTLVMSPPEVQEGNDGLIWVSQVEVTGFCVCACKPG